MKQFFILGLIFVSLLLLGCTTNSADTGANSVQATTSTPEPTEQVVASTATPTPTPVKAYSVQDLQKIILNSSDLPNDTVIEPTESGLTTEALVFHSGNKTSAKELTDNGWKGNYRLKTFLKAPFFGLDGSNSTTSAKIMDISLSVYDLQPNNKTINYWINGLTDRENGYTAVNEQNKKSFENLSAIWVNSTLEEKTQAAQAYGVTVDQFTQFIANGPSELTIISKDAFGEKSIFAKSIGYASGYQVSITVYSLFFFKKNIYVNLVVSAYGRLASQDEVEGYARKIESRI